MLMDTFAEGRAGGSAARTVEDADQGGAHGECQFHVDHKLQVFLLGLITLAGLIL